MQINNSTSDQIGISNQQIRFVPISSNVSYLGTTVNYGIGTNTGVNAFNGGSSSSGGWGGSSQVTGNVGTTAITTTPYISASQFSQMASGAFNNTIYNTQFAKNVTVQPTIDISETSSDIVVSAFVSNSAVNDLNLNVTEDSLTISGTLLSGTNQFVLNRTVPLSTSVRAEAVEATLQSGVLEVRLPKTEKFNRTTTTIGKDVTGVILSK